MVNRIQALWLSWYSPNTSDKVKGYETCCEALQKVPAAMELLSAQLVYLLNTRYSVHVSMYLLISELLLRGKRRMGQYILQSSPEGDANNTATLGLPYAGMSADQVQTV